MKEPFAVTLFEVLDSKGVMVKGLSLTRRGPTPPPGRIVAPWFPERVLIPSSMTASFKVLFPEEYAHPDVEAVITDLIGQRHVLAIYGPSPRFGESPALVEERRALEADEDALLRAKNRGLPLTEAEEEIEDRIKERKERIVELQKAPASTPNRKEPAAPTPPDPTSSNPRG